MVMVRLLVSTTFLVFVSLFFGAYCVFVVVVVCFFYVEHECGVFVVSYFCVENSTTGMNSKDQKSPNTLSVNGNQMCTRTQRTHVGKCVCV